MPDPVDVLAVAAHRDDVEQTCGGTLLRMKSLGLRTAILDLTQGEAGTRGSAEDRAREAEEAGAILGVSWRGALDIPDGRVENTWENRIKLVRKLRLLRPRVVILPYWQGRHPDHYNSGTLGYEACFLSGLARVDTGEAPFGHSRSCMPASTRTCDPALWSTSRRSSRSDFALCSPTKRSMPISPPAARFSCPTTRFANGLSP